MEIEGEGERGKKNRQQRYKEMTGGTGESRESKNKTLGRLTAMIPIIAFLLVIFFFSLIRKKESRQVKYLNPAHILQIFVLRVVQAGHQDTLSRDGES